MVKGFKAQATGNDFVFFEDRSLRGSLWDRDRQAFARGVCNRYTGIGADGLVVFHRSTDSDVDYVWEFLNSDGSSAEMCGNAARCFFRVASNCGFQGDVLRFRTLAGVVHASPDGGLVRVTMPVMRNPEFGKRLTRPEPLTVDLVHTGVPHVVMRVPAEDIRTTGDRLFRLAQDIRYSPDFLPQGTNVTLLGELSSDSILSKTYERGVEGFTLSCGTGAVAAARSQQRRSGASTIKVSVPGGDLQVVFDSSGVFLSGAAVLIAALDLTPEFLRHLSGSAIS